MHHRFRPRYLVVFLIDLALVIFARVTSFCYSNLYRG